MSIIPSLSIIVTGTKTPDRARSARKVLQILSEKASALVNVVGIYHYCTGQETVKKHVVALERTGVSELDWLLYNAANPNGQYICHVEYDNLANFRYTSFVSLQKVLASDSSKIDALRKRHVEAKAAGAKAAGAGAKKGNQIQFSLPGRLPISLTTMPITGCTCLYYNVHNNDRRLRYMDATFSGQAPKFGLLVPMTLRGITDPKSVPFLQFLGPSLAKSLQHGRLPMALYLGIDDDETIPPHTLSRIEIFVQKVLKFEFYVIRLNPEIRRQNWTACTYNVLYEAAMLDGCDFAVQLQDDAVLEKSGWDRILGSTICTTPYCTTITSLSDRFAPLTFGNVAVSRSHYDIFGYMFHPLAPDAGLWISRIAPGFCRISGTATVTNSLRNGRRHGVSGSGSVYANMGKTNETADTEGRDIFSRQYLMKFSDPAHLK